MKFYFTLSDVPQMMENIKSVPAFVLSSFVRAAGMDPACLLWPDSAKYEYIEDVLTSRAGA